MAHTCHAVGCDVRVPPKMFMCKRHWFMVPKPLRDAIWATYRSGQERDKRPSDAYLKNANEAIRAVAVKEGRAQPNTIVELAMTQPEPSYEELLDALFPEGRE